MEINVVIGQDEASKTFLKNEWALADMEHFGRAIDWDKHDAYYLKAVANNDIAGVLDMVISHGVAKIKDLIVGHKFRRRGIGRQLVQHAEHLAKQAGAHKMFLNTGKDWEARKFYQALGYQEVAILLDHSFHQDFVYFSKRIDEGVL